VGIGQAPRLLYSAETLDATEAKRIGLIEVVDSDATGAARALAGKIAENSADSIALLKSVLVQSESEPDCDHQFLAGFRSADFLSFVNRKRRQD
jgi:enoyl-CoA hydratase/carnithine racemase